MPALRRPTLAATFLILWVATAGAQGKPSAPVGQVPAATTATYGDWTLRCESGAPGAPAQGFCEVVQTLQVEGKSAPVAQVAFGRPDHGPTLHFIVALPVNVSFPSAVVVGLDAADPKPLDLAWKRCLPGACFADAIAADDALQRWRAASAGRIRYLDAAGRDVVLPLSFRGLAPALDALGKR